MLKDVRHRMLRTNGISMHVAEAGPDDGSPVIMLHGFPELWYSWRHQMPALAAAGYRAVAPDQRGFGGTDRPDAVDAYDIEHLAADVLGLLDDIGAERAAVVGHDLGAGVAWHLALAHPDRVACVSALSVPFTPRIMGAKPTDLMRALSGDRMLYPLYFQESGPADRELDTDPRTSIARALWAWSGDAPRIASIRLRPGGTGYLGSLSDPPAELPPWLTNEDIDTYAEAFARTGFTPGLNSYRNIDRNWELTEGLSGRKVAVPALYVVGDRDPVSKMTPPQVMDGWVDELRIEILPGAGHWTQQERPMEVNRLLLEFLRTTSPA